MVTAVRLEYIEQLDNLIKEIHYHPLTPSQSIKLQRASRALVCYPMYTSLYAFICWKLSGLELDSSQQMDACETMCVG